MTRSRNCCWVARTRLHGFRLTPSKWKAMMIPTTTSIYPLLQIAVLLNYAIETADASKTKLLLSRKIVPKYCDYNCIVTVWCAWVVQSGCYDTNIEHYKNGFVNLVLCICRIFRTQFCRQRGHNGVEFDSNLGPVRNWRWDITLQELDYFTTKKVRNLHVVVWSHFRRPVLPPKKIKIVKHNENDCSHQRGEQEENSLLMFTTLILEICCDDKVGRVKMWMFLTSVSRSRIIYIFSYRQISIDIAVMCYNQHFIATTSSSTLLSIPFVCWSSFWSAPRQITLFEVCKKRPCNVKSLCLSTTQGTTWVDVDVLLLKPFWKRPLQSLTKFHFL